MTELAIGATFAEHLIRGVAGRGGMGIVYRAMHVPLKREVALKVMAPELTQDGEFRARFRREFEAAAAIEHPNVIPVFHAGEEDGLLFVTMPYVTGTDLGRELQRVGRLDPVRAVKLVAQLGAALDATHALGLVHRDIKPGNVLLEPGGRVLLTDFGLTKNLRSDERITQVGSLVGTFDYTAPEQIDGAEVDGRADVYALGCLLYEVLTGSVPFPRDTLPAKMFAHISAPPPKATDAVPETPIGLNRVIARAMAKEPEDRYPSAGELAEDALEAVGASAPRAPAPDLEAAEAPVAVGRALPAQLRDEGAFVGRASALEALEARYGTDTAQFVLVAGEAGIGKTRLIAEFARRVNDRGAQVFYGRSDPESLVPYQPFITAIQHYMANRETLRFPVDLEPELRELARFVPALRRLLRGEAEPLADDAEARRYRLFEAVTRVLAFVTRETPSVLVLDDLQWADSSTALLLAHVWRDPEPTRLLVLATFREPGEEPCRELADLIANLRRDAAFERIGLEGLDEAETKELVEGRGQPESLVLRLRERTEGNPFFLLETLRTIEDGAEPDAAVPEGVKDVIARRLSRLSDIAGRALPVAAVIGREFQLPVLEALLGDDAERVLPALEEALAAGVIREDAEDVDRFLFSHALIREALYERQSASRRARLHLAVAQELERVGADPAEIAHHFLAARHLDRDGKAVGYCVQAARRASAALAYEEAAAHYRRALEAARDERTRCELLIGLAGAQLRAADPASRETFVEAAALARAQGFPELLAEAALGRATRYAEGSPVDPEAVALLEEALAAVGEREDPLVVKLLSALANSVYFQAEQERTRELSLRALELARRLDDPEALLAALQSRHTALWHVSQLEERLRLSDEWLSLARRTGAREIEAMALYPSIYNHIEIADMDAARRDHARLVELAEDLRQPLYRHFALCSRIVLSQRVSEVEQLALEAVQLGGAAHIRDAGPLYAYQLVALRYREGRLGETAPMLVAFLEQNPHLVVQLPTLALAQAEAGEMEAARQSFERVAGDDFATIPRDQLWLSAMCLAAEACVRLGDEARARILYELILPYRRLNVEMPLVCCLGSAERFLGLLSGDEEHFTAAIRDNDARGFRDAAALARADYADLLSARGERPAELLEAVIRDAEACELTKLAERASGSSPPTP